MFSHGGQISPKLGRHDVMTLWPAETRDFEAPEPERLWERFVSDEVNRFRSFYSATAARCARGFGAAHVNSSCMAAPESHRQHLCL